MNVLVEEWLQRGEAQGYLRGIKQGLEKQLEIQRKMLGLLLTQRFSNAGTISDTVAEAAKRLGYVKTESELDTLTNIVLTVPDLDRFMNYLPPVPEDEVIDSNETEIAGIESDEMAHSY